MNLFEFLNENYFFLVPALWVVGYAMKQTPKVPDWSIIWILLGISLGMGTLAFGFTAEAITNAIIAAGVSVFGHQLVKQTTVARNGKN